MNLYYKREFWNDGRTIYRMIIFRLRQNRGICGEKMKEEDDMHKYGEGDTAIGLDNLKQRYIEMDDNDKTRVERNLAFASRNKRLERGAGKIVLRSPEKIELFKKSPEEEDEEDEEDERQQHTQRNVDIQTNIDRKLKNSKQNKILNLLDTINHRQQSEQQKD